MKAVFFYSAKAANLETSSPFTTEQVRLTADLSIDGKPYTEVLTLEDDAEFKSSTQWDDNVLVAVVENVDVYDSSTYKTMLYSGPLAGRIKINGVVHNFRKEKLLTS